MIAAEERLLAETQSITPPRRSSGCWGGIQDPAVDVENCAPATLSMSNLGYSLGGAMLRDDRLRGNPLLFLDRCWNLSE